jgi:aldose 1-epimerase
MIKLVSPDGKSNASINPIGAALGELWFGANQIAGSPDGFSGVTMFPWPNRIYGGVWNFNGAALELPINDVEQNSALHGLVYEAEFDYVQPASNSCELGYQLNPSVGYPFQMRLNVNYFLNNGELEICQTVTNETRTAAPFGIGFHPYFKAAAESEFASNTKTFVMGELEVDETLGPSMQHAMLTTQSYRLEMTSSDTEYVHVFVNRYSTPGTLWFAMEPQTSPVDSLNTGVGISTLLPDESKQFRYRLAWR